MLTTDIGIRQRLERERNRLQTVITRLRNQDSELGPTDREHNQALEMNLQRSLAQVEQALLSFDSAAYGLCDACRLPIDPERLRAMPYATLCLACKESQERTGNRRRAAAMTGSPGWSN